MVYAIIKAYSVWIYFLGDSSNIDTLVVLMWTHVSSFYLQEQNLSYDLFHVSSAMNRMSVYQRINHRIGRANRDI